MRDDSDSASFENLRHGGYNREENVAEELIDGGDCNNYDEAYAVLRSMRSGEVIKTYRGFMKKQ